MKLIPFLVAIQLAAVAMCGQAIAQETICPRATPGSEVSPPADIYSKHGVLKVSLGYDTVVDQYGRTLFCYQTPGGKESPTLHVKPGDQIRIKLTNKIPPVQGGMLVSNTSDACGSPLMNSASVNMHFHGMNISPTCHSDEVIRTLVDSGQTFEYVLNIPKDEPPGLYWYHPHVHGIASPAVQGGATGIIEVEGIANIQPIVAGLPERFIAVRDGPLQNPPPKASALFGVAPYWDLSINYVPVPYPTYPPAILKMNPGTQEFWRVANTSADTILDLQLIYDGVAQPVTVVGLDGVPVGSQDGKHQGTTFTETDVYIPPASRAEFIVTAPTANVKSAVLLTNKIDTGPAGDVDTKRTLATIQTTNADIGLPRTEERSGPPTPPRFADLANAKVTAHRRLYFSEQRVRAEKDPPWGGPGHMDFFVTVQGQSPNLFNPNAPPAITTTQGAVEDWTIANHATEVHEFHMHQIHFLLLAVNGKPVPKAQQQFYDTYQVGYWKGKGPYPSIKVRMDFRGAVVGDFVYHCHILDHEDGGMMAKIRVLPKS